MHNENTFALGLVKDNKLGEIQFSRISLYVSADERSVKDDYLKECLSFIRQLHQERIDSLYASSDEKRQVYMITIQFINQSLATIFLDFNYHHAPDYIKKFEISGKKALYQYDSRQKDAFASDFLKPEPYLPSYEENWLDSIWLAELLTKIEYSIKHNQLLI